MFEMDADIAREVLRNAHFCPAEQRRRCFLKSKLWYKKKKILSVINKSVQKTYLVPKNNFCDHMTMLKRHHRERCARGRSSAPFAWTWKAPSWIISDAGCFLELVHGRLSVCSTANSDFDTSKRPDLCFCQHENKHTCIRARLWKNGVSNEQRVVNVFMVYCVHQRVYKKWHRLNSFLSSMKRLFLFLSMHLFYT